MSEIQLQPISEVQLSTDQDDQIKTYRTFSFQWRGEIRDYVEEKACELQPADMQNTELICRALDRDPWRVTIYYVEEAIALLQEVGKYTVEDNSWISSEEMEEVHRAESLLIESMLREWSCVQVEVDEFDSYQIALDQSVEKTDML